MKNFYSCEMKRNYSTSIRHEEYVEYDINTLIKLEAESEIECDANFSNVTDEEFAVLAKQRAMEIKDELIENGIYKNKYGQPVFLYC